jgi:arginine:ornithine antiporter / lysine permease
MASQDEQKLPLFSLAAMVIGSMVGAGIFNLPGRFATATGPFGAIIAWAIAGTGMYMLARVFQALAEKRPDIDSGVFAYAKADSATTWASYRPSATGSGAASATSFTGC